MAKVRVNWGPTEENCSVRLFVVYNTAHRSLYVLARDERTAMSVAYTANHVYSPEVKYADSYSRSVYEILSPSGHGLADHWGLIREAIAQRLEGTVHVEDDDICVGSQPLLGRRGALRMGKYTERVRFSLPAEAKERLKAEAQYHGISLSEHIRRKVHRQMELEDEIESRALLA